MKKSITIKLLLVALCVLLAGCSGGGGGGETAGKYRDTFYFAIAGEPRQIDPSIIDDSVTGALVGQIYWPLFSTDGKGNLVNQACVGYEVSDDGMEYTIHLSEKNTWSDGKPVTADDYIYGWKRTIGMGRANSYYVYEFCDYVLNAAAHDGDDIANMDDVGFEKVNDYTIKITLSTPCPFFASMMPASVWLPQRADVTKEHTSDWANDVNNIITNGAFKVVSLDATTEFDMVKNEYFANADQVISEKLVGLVITDQDAQRLAFENGEVDYASSLNADVAVTMAGSPALQVYMTPANYYMMLNSYNDDCPALKDERVRRAIALGIDRQAFVTALELPDLYYELNGFVPKGVPQSDGRDFRTVGDEMEKLVYTDKDAARKLMEEAGYSETNRLSVTYYYNQTALHDTVSAIIKAQLADVYIDVTLKTAEIRTFFEDREQARYEMCRGGFSCDYYDPSNFTDLCKTTGVGPVVSLGDEVGDEMIKKAQNMSGAERDAYLHEIETYMIKEKSYYVPLMGYGSFALVNPNAVGVERGRFWYAGVPVDADK
ncbi:MAG: peptide ABC transporter substrate-binding protein [Eubacteriales bacterium]|nr:peptide ABC transporter substrate-binding protein [Eubacteriales bacterium]